MLSTWITLIIKCTYRSEYKLFVGFRFLAKMQSSSQKLQIFLVSSLQVVQLFSYLFSARMSNVAMLLKFFLAFQRKMWSVMLFIKHSCPLYDKMLKVRFLSSSVACLQLLEYFDMHPVVWLPGLFWKFLPLFSSGMQTFRVENWFYHCPNPKTKISCVNWCQA